jgi:hypothetical protein
MIVKFKFPKYFSKQVYNGIQKSKKITGTYEIHSNVLYAYVGSSSGDVEEIEKIFDRLVLNYKIV